MSDREIVYLNGDGTVANVVVIGADDPNALLATYGYAEWIDRADTPGASVGWQRIGSEWRPPQPHPSWVWQDERWQAPSPYPAQPGPWVWDEDSTSWVHVDPV